MILVPLQQIGWREHKSALWWLGLLYRRPAQFEQETEACSRAEKLRISFWLYLHFLPYLVFVCVIGRVLVFNVLGLAPEQVLSNTWEVVSFHLRGIAWGIAFGIAVGIAGGISLLRVYYQPFHLFFVWPTLQSGWYPYHPVAWDDLCVVPFPRLARLLVAYAELEPKAGAAEVERLISHYPSQRLQALRAQTILLAREAGRAAHLALLDGIVARLPHGEKGFLRETLQLRELVREIASLQRRLDTIDRAILREPTAQLLCTEIENFRHQIGGFREPLATEFRAAATYWLEVAQRQLREAQAMLTKEPSPQVFRAGDPVNRDQEAFVPRYNVVGELEKQIMLSTGCPGVILYGRRRMGKSTILRNLTGFLPDSVIPTFLSMQNPQAFASLASFVGLLVQQIHNALPNDAQLGSSPDDLPSLFRLLTQSNDYCAATGKRLVLGVDEYENIDRKIGEGAFPEDLLSTMRESIQSHRALTWIFAGSHQIIELSAAPWTSYLVSARTIEVPAFTLEETRLLLTEPLKHSSLWEKNAAKRPHFAPEFWGDSGIERIHHEAGGWPHLVQLIAETTIDLLNDEDSRAVDAALLERALDTAIVRGDTVLFELLRRESTLPGEWEYLTGFRTRDTQPPPGDEAIYASLRKRLLVENENGDWRLRVPLMARWLRQRG